MDLEDTLKEALLETERARRELAECRSEALVLSAQLKALEERAQALQEAVERDKEEVLKEVLAEALDRVADALAKRAKPSFAEDEKGPLASFKVGGELVVLRPEVGESNRMFKTRVWRAWLERALG